MKKCKVGVLFCKKEIKFAETDKSFVERFLAVFEAEKYDSITLYTHGRASELMQKPKVFT